MFTPCSPPVLPLVREPTEELIKHQSCLSHHYLPVQIIITKTAAAEEQGEVWKEGLFRQS